MDAPEPPDDAPVLLPATALLPAAGTPLVLLDGVGLVVAKLDAARGYAEASRAPGTRRAYASDWRASPVGASPVAWKPCRPIRAASRCSWGSGSKGTETALVHLAAGGRDSPKPPIAMR